MALSRSFQTGLKQLEEDIAANKFIVTGRLSDIVDRYHPHMEKNDKSVQSLSSRIEAILKIKMPNSSQQGALEALQNKLIEKRDSLPSHGNFKRLNNYIKEQKWRLAENLAEELVANLDRKLMQQRKQPLNSHKQLLSALKKLRAARPNGFKAELIYARLMTKFDDFENANRFYVKAIDKTRNSKFRGEIKKEYDVFCGMLANQQKPQKTGRKGQVDHQTIRPSQWKLKNPPGSPATAANQGFFSKNKKPTPNKDFSVRLSPQTRSKNHY